MGQRFQSKLPSLGASNLPMRYRKWSRALITSLGCFIVSEVTQGPSAEYICQTPRCRAGAEEQLGSSFGHLTSKSIKEFQAVIRQAIVASLNIWLNHVTRKGGWRGSSEWMLGRAKIVAFPSPR